jgi:nicotinamidase/pyrazinamidase
MNALILVDIQNDFMSGGALAVPQGNLILPITNAIQQKFDLVIATQDWHPQGHKSFASSHPGKKIFATIELNGLEQVLWPDHCVQGTSGADFHKDLDTTKVEAIFRKGMDVNIDSYSGLYDNGRRKSTGMAGYLKERNVTKAFVCGLASDYCVYFTAKDLIQDGFETFFIEDATRPISNDGFSDAKSTLRQMGAHIITHADLSSSLHLSRK